MADRYPPEVLSDAEVRRLLDACGPFPTGRRNRALLPLLYRCGLRIAEALALMPSDYQPARQIVHVRRGKGGKRRTLGIDAGGAAIVDRWVKGSAEFSLRPACGDDRTERQCTPRTGR